MKKLAVLLLPLLVRLSLCACGKSEEAKVADKEL